MTTRQIPLTGQDNFRDLGGYQTLDGRRVKWRHLYRSGELTELSADDLEKLAGLGIRTVVDLRGEVEVANKGPVRLPPGASVTRLPIEPGDLTPVLGPAFATGDFSTVPEDLLPQINRAYIREWGHQLGALLEIAADSARCPLVFHCTQGKDRAGINAAILLSALGVPWQTVVEDYLLSNVQRYESASTGMETMRRKAARQRGVEPDEVDMSNIRGLFFVDASYIGAAHEEMIVLHGSIEAFIRDDLGWSGAELSRLRDGLLE